MLTPEDWHGTDIATIAATAVRMDAAWVELWALYDDAMRRTGQHVGLVSARRLGDVLERRGGRPA